MQKLSKARVKISVYLPGDLLAQIKTMADTLGLKFSDIMVLITTAGFTSLKMSQDPVWKNYFESQMEENIERKTRTKAN